MNITNDIKEVEVSIPIHILKDRTLAPLEAISMYLKDARGRTYHQIAELVNRNDRTIWTCYNRGKKKNDKPLKLEQTSEPIPLEVLRDRNLAPLEAVSTFLKETRNLTYHQIAELVNRDDRTIWTCCDRAKKKLGEVVQQ